MGGHGGNGGSGGAGRSTAAEPRSAAPLRHKGGRERAHEGPSEAT